MKMKKKPIMERLYNGLYKFFVGQPSLIKSMDTYLMCGKAQILMKRLNARYKRYDAYFELIDEIQRSQARRFTLKEDSSDQKAEDAITIKLVEKLHIKFGKPP